MESPVNNLVKSFLSVESRRELAGVFDSKYSTLMFNLFALNIDRKYKEFEIKKRNGKSRTIYAPVSGIKFFQRRLANVLLDIYPPKKCIHGFVKSRGILSNSQLHLKKKFLLNIDIENFFHSINFGRVRSLFKSHPFNFNDEVATCLAQIACHKNILPQGSPSSPIISNFICRRLDNMFLDLARKYKFTYTRYADDITISTNDINAIKHLGTISNSKIALAEEIINLVESNGFKINNNKLRYAFKNNRQEVTGIIVNQFPNVNRKYIRHVRAMINAWEKYGIDKASKEHFEKYNYKNKKVSTPEISFENELIGKVGFIGSIRGKNDIIYYNLIQRIKRLNPQVNLSIVQKAINESNLPLIFGEGKSDWKHLKRALEYLQEKGKLTDIEVSFQQYEDKIDINNSQLLTICEGLSKSGLASKKVLCIFDRVTPSLNSKIADKKSGFKFWGNNVYSVLIPKPSHRDFDEICIEHFYTDDELKTLDENQRRLFLSTEFDSLTGKHKEYDLFAVNKRKLKVSYPKIIDSQVFDDRGNNNALSKNDFAENILAKKEEFKEIKFDSFEELYTLIQLVLLHKE